MQGDEVLRVKSRFNPSAVHRRGDMVVRDSGPWTPAVHALLRHLEDSGFKGAPRLVGSGFDSEGRETLTYIEGEVIDGGPDPPWTLESVAAVGAGYFGTSTGLQLPTVRLQGPYGSPGLGAI